MTRLRLVIGLVAVAAAIGLPAPAAAQEVVRLAGPSRLDTAVAVSQFRWPDGAPVTYLARADVFADALAAGPLADGPTLLVPSCGPVPPVVIDELRRLAPADVVALGGTAAVCDATLAEAADAVGADPGRLAGDSRFATAAAISQAAHPDGAARVYVVPPDAGVQALAAGAATDAAVLLTPADGSAPPQVVIDAIAALDPDEVVVVADPFQISREVADQLAQGRPVRRLDGSSPETYAAAVSLDVTGGGPTSVAYLVRGDVIADGLAAGSLVGGPIVAVPSCGELPGAARQVLSQSRPGRVVVLGGTAAVCDDVVAQSRQAASLRCDMGAFGQSLEETSLCLYLAWRAGDVELAREFADPPAIDKLFASPWSLEWHFGGCRFDPNETNSWVGQVCDFVEPAPPGAAHGVGIRFLFNAYDDVVVVGDIGYDG